jgi:DNA-binding GntR family transcriptional regulator
MAEPLPRLSAATLGDQAYDAMREAIVSGTLQRGEKVTERGLAESLNISPTPVREALRRLEQDRLVERLGPRSVRIAKLDDTELREITLIEDALRALSARLAAEKATQAQLDEMQALLDNADYLCRRVITAKPGSSAEKALVIEVLTAMRRFHELVDLASGNPTLIQMLRMVDAFESDERRQSVLSEMKVNRPKVGDRYQEHRAIFDAIAGHDPERAEELTLAHSRSSNSSRLNERFSR